MDTCKRMYSKNELKSNIINKEDVSNIAIPYARTDTKLEYNKRCFCLSDIQVYGETADNKGITIYFQGLTNVVNFDDTALGLYNALIGTTYNCLYGYDEGDTTLKAGRVSKGRTELTITLDTQLEVNISVNDIISIDKARLMTIYY